jgi:hypothetical protein
MSWPSKLARNLENAMNARLTALSINSMHIKTVIILRRKMNPAAPRTKRMTLSAK